jgi:RHS repeat-associated protein
MKNSTQNTVDYLDGFQYAGDILQFFPTTEGYVKATPVGNANPDLPPTGYAYNYTFNYTDHLGNIRLSYTKDPQSGTLQILEENHYYPFGLRHEIYVTGSKRQHGFGNDGGGGDIDDVELINVLRTDYQYKYNGMELQDELGLNMYDMDMRQYDPAIARWVVMDPVIHHSMSPYSAFDNNPVFWADPSGAAVDSFLELYEREKNHEHLIQRLLYDKTNEFIMEGGIGFFNGDPTNNYPPPGEEGSPENPIILEPAMLRPPNSFTAVALRAYANSYNGPQFSPPNFFFFKRTNETFYSFNNGLINDTDGFGSDFWRPGDEVRSAEMIPIGADAVGTAGFDFLKDVGILKKKKKIVDRWVHMTYTDKDSLMKMSYSELLKYGSPRVIDSFHIKGTVKEYHDKIFQMGKNGDTIVWPRGYPLIKKR